MVSFRQEDSRGKPAAFFVVNMVAESAKPPNPDLRMPRWLWCGVHLHLQVWVLLTALGQLSEPKLLFSQDKRSLALHALASL